MSEILLAAALAVMLLGLYGMSTTRDLVRMVIMMEVLTVGAFLAVLPSATAIPSLGITLALILIGGVAAETVLLVALIYRYYRYTGTTDTMTMDRGKETP